MQQVGPYLYLKSKLLFGNACIVFFLFSFFSRFKDCVKTGDGIRAKKSGMIGEEEERGEETRSRSTREEEEQRLLRMVQSYNL